MTQERRHLRENVPQMLKQQIPNHQLHKISHKRSPPLDSSHKTNPSLNSSHKMNPSLNSSHKMSPSLNSIHKACLPLNNNHKTKHLTLSHLNPAMMIHHFQIMPKLSNFYDERSQLYTKETEI